MIEIRLFGNPLMTQDGAVLEMSCRKGWSLLAILAGAGGAAVDRGRIAGELWPENDEHHARRALATTLWRLGRVAAAPLIEARGDSLRLAEGVRCDLAEFRRLVHRGCAGAADAGALEAAVALQGDDLLPTEDGAWCAIERESLRALLVVALDRLMALQADGQDHARMLETARRLIAVEPFMEHAHRAAIQALGALGERVQALRQFRQCQEILRRELGVEPMPETLAALRQAIGAEGGAETARQAAGLRPDSGEVLARLRSHLRGASQALEDLGLH